MGKFAQYQKRGSAKQQGYLTRPAPADYSIGTITATSIAVNQPGARPPTVDAISARALLTATGKFVSQSPITSSTVATVLGLTTVTAYTIQMAWFAGSAQISDWSAGLPATTI